MKRSEFRVAFCYNVHPDDDNLSNDEKFAEFDSKDTIGAVYDSLSKLGFNVTSIEYDSFFIENLKNFNPDLIFNIVEGHQGEDRESQAPAIYEFLGIPYTGSTPMGHALSLNKVMGKRVMEHCGVKTAPFFVCNEKIDTNFKCSLEFPLIVKPIHEGSSIGVHNDSIVRNLSELIKQTNLVIEKYDQPALIEKFIQGREFNQALIGNNGDIIQFPIVEIDYSYLPPEIEKFSSFEVKTTLDDPKSTICPAKLTESQKKRISEATLGAYHACEIRDYARIDLRMDENDNVYILEINSIPGIAPGISENNSMPKAINVYGWNYTEMIDAILKAAFKRYSIKFED